MEQDLSDMSSADFLRDLAARILHMPAQRVDQGDSDRLREIAVDLENMEGCVKFPAVEAGYKPRK